MKFRPTLAAIGLGVSRALPPWGPMRKAADLRATSSRARQLAYTCHGCHGVPNYKNAYPNYSVPQLGGQNAPVPRERAARRTPPGERPHHDDAFAGDHAF